MSDPPTAGSPAGPRSGEPDEADEPVGDPGRQASDERETRDERDERERRRKEEEDRDMRGTAALTSSSALELPETARTGDLADAADPDLVALAQEGSHRAFEVLVRRYSERAYHAAYRVVRDGDQAQDVVQEALIKAYRGLRSFESRSSFYTWLYRIVVNLALDKRRRDQRVPGVEWDEGVAHDLDPRAIAPVDQDPELATRRAQIRELVAQGVETLPDGQREVLLLREVDGLSYEEIAQSMQISKGTVMSRLHYARKKLIAFLQEQGVDPSDVESTK